MGALDKKRDRSIDSLWRGNDALIAAVEAAVGVPIGSDDGVLFIQDVGTKIYARAYIDKNTGRLYKCITTPTTTTTNNGSDFVPLSLQEFDAKYRPIQYVALERGVVIWKCGNIQGIMFTNSIMDESWEYRFISSMGKSHAYKKNFVYPDWFKLPTWHSEIGVSISSSDICIYGEVMVRHNQIEVFVVNALNYDTPPAASSASLSGCASWPVD